MATTNKFHGWDIKKGNTYICEKCGKMDVHDRDYADMVMEFEILTGREFDPLADDIIMTCNACGSDTGYIDPEDGGAW